MRLVRVGHHGWLGQSGTRASTRAPVLVICRRSVGMSPSGGCAWVPVGHMIAKQFGTPLASAQPWLDGVEPREAVVGSAGEKVEW